MLNQFKSLSLVLITCWVNFAAYVPLALGQSTLDQLERRAWTEQDEYLDDLEKEVVRSIQIDPQSPRAFYVLAHISLRKFSQNADQLGYMKLATDLAQQALDLDPESDFGFIAVAESLDTMGQFERALSLLTGAAQAGLSPSWRYYFTLARLEAQKNSFERVLGLLEQAMGIAGSDHDIIAPYVVALLQASAAASDLERNLESWDLKFPHPLFKQALANHAMDQGQYATAHQRFVTIYRDHPLALEAKINDAILLYRSMNRSKDAVQLLTEVKAEYLRNPRSLSAEQLNLVDANLGASLLRDHRVGEAEAYFVQAIRVSKDPSTMLEFCANAYRSAGYSKLLVGFLEKMRYETRPTALHYALIAESQSEDLKQQQLALQSYADAILLDPNQSAYYNGMGLSYFRLNQFDEALDLFQQAARIDPADASSVYNGACVYAKLGRVQDALGALQSAFGIDPSLTEHARNDPDLGSLTSDPEFQRLLAEEPRNFDQKSNFDLDLEPAEDAEISLPGH